MLMKKTLTLAIALAATLSLQAQNRSDLPDLSTIISSQPEGTLHKDVNHYFEGCYVYPSDGSIYDYFADGCVADLVEATTAVSTSRIRLASSPSMTPRCGSRP